MVRSRLSRHPIAVVRQATRRRMQGDESGFTLIELVITIVILPIIIGAIAAALLSVFDLQQKVSNRLGDSNDLQVGSASFNKDAQSAANFETSTTPACGPAGQTQIVGLEWAYNTSALGNYQSVVSYVRVPLPAGGFALVRNICNFGDSTSPDGTLTVSRDVGSPQVTATAGVAPNQSVICTTASACTWTSTQGVSSILISGVEPNSGLSFSLNGLPGQSSSGGSVTNVQANPVPAGCNFASTGSGTYATPPQLCFADFSGVNLTATTPCAGGAAGTVGTAVSLPIANTPDVLKFCVTVSGSAVKAASIPTYYNPGSSGYNSEAFLGNNGFYTGIPGKPAIYQTAGGDSIVKITNITVSNAVGQPATNWVLVTGDAESTDTGEWLEFSQTTPGLTWDILPNNGASDLYGDSCYDGHDANNNGLLQYTGPVPASNSTVGNSANGPPPSGNWAALPTLSAPNYQTNVTGILCEGDIQLNKTGSLMLSSPEPSGSNAAQSFTATLHGGGLQGMFLGVLI
jgi:prepilin-type N-terminal cleavage/methylation domain-containing protein